MFIHFDSLADRARFDELLDVLTNKPFPGHLDGLLLASLGVFMQCLDRGLHKSWRQKEDSSHTSGGLARRSSLNSFPFFSGQEKSGVDAYLSVANSV